MSVVAIIPARGGSRGIPHKNLQRLGGLPLVRWPINAARECRSVDAVYVSTDSNQIAVTSEYGATVIHRPSRLAIDSALTPPVVVHAIEAIAPAPEIVVVLQCTTPFTSAEDIDQAVGLLLKDAETDVVVSVCPCHIHQLRLIPRGVEWMTPGGIYETPRRQDRPPTYRLNGGIFVYRVEAFLAAQLAIYGTVRLHVMPEERSVEIDTPYDLTMARAYYETMGG